MKKNKLIFAPFELGLKLKGASQGIYLLKNKQGNLLNNTLVLNLEDLKESPTYQNMNNFDSIKKMINIVSESISSLKSKDIIPITIGGDHSISIGTISGVLKKESNLGVIWIDAHGDMNTNVTSDSGNVHGMVLSTLQGLGHNELIDSLKLDKYLQTKNIYIYGTRDLDIKENELINEINLNYTSHFEIIEKGLETTLNNMITYFKERNVAIHLSIDLDCLNPIYAPGVSVPVKGGFNKKELFEITSKIMSELEVISIDVVEYNPLRDIDNITLEILIDLIKLITKGDF